MREKTILLVDDSPDDELLTIDALRQASIKNVIRVARDGAEAIEVLKSEQPPDLVLLDLKLPKVAGFDVLRSIRERPETRFLPVIVVTSSSEPSDMERAYLGGANSYVRKPVDYDEFLKAVRTLGQYWLEYNHVPYL